MRKIGDRLSMALLVVFSAGTLGALVMTSAAKKMGLTGAPPSGAAPPGPPSEKEFHDRLKALEKM